MGPQRVISPPRLWSHTESPNCAQTSERSTRASAIVDNTTKAQSELLSQPAWQTSPFLTPPRSLTVDIRATTNPEDRDGSACTSPCVSLIHSSVARPVSTSRTNYCCRVTFYICKIIFCAIILYPYLTLPSQNTHSHHICL